MTFGLSTIGNQHDLYRVIEQQEQPVKFLDYSHVVRILIFSRVIVNYASNLN